MAISYSYVDAEILPLQTRPDQYQLHVVPYSHSALAGFKKHWLTATLLLAAALICIAVFLSVWPTAPARAQSVADLSGALGAVLGIFWAIYKFAYERRVRSSDVLFKLNEDFNKHSAVVGQIESDDEYQVIAQRLREALVLPSGAGWSPLLRPVDNLLRHFLLVYSLDTNRQIDRETVQLLYRWYAHLLTWDKRIAMRVFVHKYYPTLAGFFEDEKIFPDSANLIARRQITREHVETFIGDLPAFSSGREYPGALGKLKAELV